MMFHLCSPKRPYRGTRIGSACTSKRVGLQTSLRSMPSRTNFDALSIDIEGIDRPVLLDPGSDRS